MKIIYSYNNFGTKLHCHTNEWTYANFTDFSKNDIWYSFKIRVTHPWAEQNAHAKHFSPQGSDDRYSQGEGSGSKIWGGQEKKQQFGRMFDRQKSQVCGRIFQQSLGIPSAMGGGVVRQASVPMSEPSIIRIIFSERTKNCQHSKWSWMKTLLLQLKFPLKYALVSCLNMSYATFDYVRWRIPKIFIWLRRSSSLMID